MLLAMNWMQKKSMSISDEDKKLFRDTVREMKPQQQVEQSQEDMEDIPREHYSDHLNDENVSADAKLSYFNQTLPHKVRKQLQKGQFDIEDILDLHRLTVEDAREDIADFLQASSAQGCRCVLIVHGKGRDLNTPILKNKVKQWLPQSKYVLAFCSCLPKHGGTGAVYVLLR